MMQEGLLIHSFTKNIDGISLPERFTYPFNYEPHPLCQLAATELQQRLLDEDLPHNFGLGSRQTGQVLGKMFGVLVVKNKQQELAYLAAFSGRLGEQNFYPGFVPPVYDTLEPNGVFLKAVEKIDRLSDEIYQIETSAEYQRLSTQYDLITKRAQATMQRSKAQLKYLKHERKKKRKAAEEKLSSNALERLNEELRKESLQQQYTHKDLVRYWKNEVLQAEEKLQPIAGRLAQLRIERKQLSNTTQDQIFDAYHFLNAKGDWRSLKSIFGQFPPPSGAGECAAPRLLQYAFLQQLQPIAMAEFWWGQSPVSEVRHHQQFYPACRGKCEPILSHMLEGLEVDPNPLLQNPGLNKKIEIIFEDDDLIIVHKPPELLSVPGKNIRDSVLWRIQQKYPDLEGPIIVHRLDMSTSGVMVLAKNKKAYHHLQSQFIKRKVQKRYVALLDGIPQDQTGEIDLPLRVDLDNRPRQLVCYEHGKPALTRWKFVKQIGERALVHFFPITGRTHQLRVHAAHHKGIGIPIYGDDLYGVVADRLYLHAEEIIFTHPKNQTLMIFSVQANFSFLN
ncbi:MAG: RluA family pseudouridine synthase [Bacteroidota bacterium]